MKAFRLSVVLILSVGVRLAYTGWVGIDPVSDFAVYEELAHAVSSGEGYAYIGEAGLEELRLYRGDAAAFVPQATAWRAPGTAFLGAILYKTIGRLPVLFVLWNLVASLLIGFFVFSLSESRRAGVVAAAIWSLLPSTIAATPLFGSELVHTAAVLGAAWSFDRDERLSGGLAAVACLFRPLGIVLVVAGVVAGRGNSRRCLAFLLAFIAVSAPWAIRNRLVFGSWTPYAASGGDVFARHTASLIPYEERDVARYTAWRNASSEVEKSSTGFSVGVWNLVSIWSSPRRIPRALAAGLDSAFLTDRQTVFWSKGGKALERTASMAYYLLILLAMMGGYHMLGSPASDGMRFLGVHFALTVALLILIPSVDRYHFPLLPYWAILGGLALTRSRRYP